MSKMTPKEKAMEIAMKFDKNGETDNAIKCALICVDEVLPYTIEYQEHLVSEHRRKTYWQEVKKELELLKDE